jgi:hypothetical protein
MVRDVRRCVVLLLIALAACGGGGHPRTVAVPPLATTPSATPVAPVTSVVVSPSPEVLRFPATRAGAIAIAKAFYTEIGIADVSGDTSRYRQMIEPTCPCAKAASDIDARPSGETHTGEVVSIVSTKLTTIRRYSAALTVTYDVTPSIAREAGGASKPFSGLRGEVDALSLEENGGAWLVIASRTLLAGKAFRS